MKFNQNDVLDAQLFTTAIVIINVQFRSSCERQFRIVLYNVDCTSIRAYMSEKKRTNKQTNELHCDATFHISNSRFRRAVNLRVNGRLFRAHGIAITDFET